MNQIIIKKAKEHVFSHLDKNTPANNVYHNSDHTKEVVKAGKTIAKGMRLSDDDVEIIILAALFHDLGYLEIIKGHEKISDRYAEEFLKKEKYPDKKIIKIKGCILATKVPQKPKNILEKVICDSDLSHLGKESFSKRNNMFRDEFEFHFGRTLTDKEFLKMSINFLKNHKFFTKYAIENLEPRKQKNLYKLKEALKKLSTLNQ